MTTLIRLDPLREVTAMHNELSRLMQGLFEGGNGVHPQHWVPSFDVWETEKELVYAFDLPGVPQDKISIEVENGMLTVTAERERSSEVSREQAHRFERRFGTFTRTVGLPQGVAEDSIDAEFTDGVLEIHVAKPEAAKPKRIQISGSDPAQQVIDSPAPESAENN